MKSLFYNSAMIFVFLITLTSCGKEYTFQKVVFNNTEKEIVVQYDCCGNEEEFIIPSGEEKVVFICTYQSFQKPDCSSVEGKFSWTFSDLSNNESFNKNAATNISNSENWTFKEDGKKLSCEFTIESQEETILKDTK